MENKLKMLFEYQRFEKNQRLQAMIDESESSFVKELADEDLFMLNAAGEIIQNPDKPETEK